MVPVSALLHNRYRLALLANCLALAGGMAISWKLSSIESPVISYLLSRSMDSLHATPASMGMLLSALLLAFAAGGLRQRAARIAIRTGCAGLVLMAVLAFFVESLGTTHDVLTACTLLSLLLGIGIELQWTWKQSRHPALFFPIACIGVVMLLLVEAYLLPDYFDGTHWWRNLALAEWSLIALIDGSIYLLLGLAQAN